MAMMGTSSTSENRSGVASARQRKLRRRGWLTDVIDEAKSASQTLANASPQQLRAHTDKLRRFVQSKQDPSADSMLILSAAGVIEAIRRTLGLTLFDVQIHASLVVSLGAVAEMQTGEGKTLSVALPAYVRSLAGRGVHVATPSEYLARRDHDKLVAAFELLGVTTGLITESMSTIEKQNAYRADVTYAAAHAFGFDYLRDQLSLGSSDQRRLGEDIYSLAMSDQSCSTRLQRGLAAVIIDEIDHVLIDDAVSPLLLSGSQTGPSPDAQIHHAAMDWADQMSLDVDFEIQAGGQLRLTQVGLDRVYSSDAAPFIVHPELVRPWHEYVVAALRAKHCYQRDIHFVVRDQQVQIVDGSTGRIFHDRTWSDGLHQAIEARQGLAIQAEAKPLARITRQRFFRQYKFIGGMTGTASGCEREFASVYGLPVNVVPLRVESKRIVMPFQLTVNQQKKWAMIADQTQAVVNAGRAVLIGTLSISESLEVASHLESRGIAFELLNGVQDDDEAALISKAGQVGVVTVATNLAGRGTDIVLSPEVKAAGGLHVIVVQKHVLGRVDRQLIGRCARCGDPGTAQVFVSADDLLVAKHAPWIARAIERWGRNDTSLPPNIFRTLGRVQARQQRIDSATRRRLLKSDQDIAQLWARSRPTPQRCWQL
jgi:preprotein translocase subunit SecA